MDVAVVEKQSGAIVNFAVSPAVESFVKIHAHFFGLKKKAVIEMSNNLDQMHYW